MSNEVNVSLFGSGVIMPQGAPQNWFLDFAESDYNSAMRRVRTFSVVPHVYVDDSDSSGPSRPLGLPGDAFPSYEQWVEVSSVFYLLKANSAQLQLNVIVRSLTPHVPVNYVLMMAETDN